MSAYIKLSTMEYPRYPGDLAIDPMGANDYALVSVSPFPEYNFERQEVMGLPPVQVNGEWRQEWAVVQTPDSEGAIRVRFKRNEKLKESDWTQIPDVPVDKQAWATYRQALRDITTQTGFPWEITWPDAP